MGDAVVGPMEAHVPEPPSVAAAAAHRHRSPIGGILLGAILSGIGIFFVILWIIYLPGYWLYFLGVPVAIGGAFIFFRSITGPDAAE
jgi:hypothetical protein